MNNVRIRVLSLLAIALACFFATASTAYAEVPDYHPNLTVGTELVGSDPAKWQQDGGICTYEGTGYVFSADFSSGSASSATLTLTEGDYSGYYQYTAADGTLHEVGAVISVNYVFDSSLDALGELRIESIDAGGMEINMSAHDPNANTDYSDTTSPDICYGGIWANDCNLSLATANSSVITSSEDVLTASQVKFISGHSVEIDAKISMGDINVVAMPREESYAGESPVGVYGIFSMDEAVILPDAVVELDEIAATSKNVTEVIGLVGFGEDGTLIIEEGGSVKVGTLRAIAGFSFGSASPAEVAGIRFDYVENNGGIFVDDVALTYENDDSQVGDAIGAWAMGLYVYEALENAGVIQVLNAAVSLDVAQGDPEEDDRHSVDATGLYCGDVDTMGDCVLRAKPGSELVIGAEPGTIEVSAYAPNASAISVNTHGIFAWGAVEVEDARVEARNGVATGKVQDDESKLLQSGMFVLTDLVVKGDSRVSMILNENGDASGFGGFYKMRALSCDILFVSDTASVVCDGHGAICPDIEEALEAHSKAKLDGYASLALWGPMSKTASVCDGSGAVEVGSDFATMVDYGSSPDATQSDASLTDAKGRYYYDQFPYVRIYNQKLIDYLTIDGKRVCYTQGQNIATLNADGTLEDIPNATWDNESKTLSMSGASMGTVRFYPPEGSNLHLTIDLAPGSSNRIAGEVGIDCHSNVKMQGAGDLLVECTGEGHAVQAGIFTLDGGANVSIKVSADLVYALNAPSGVLVNNGILNTNSAIATVRDIVVEKQGTINCVITDPGSAYGLLTSTIAGVRGGKVIVRGTVNVENMTDTLYEGEVVVHGQGIGADDGLTVDGGTLTVKALSFGITTFGNEDMEVVSGTVNVESVEESAIALDFFGESDKDTLVISGGDVTATSASPCAVAAHNLKMTGGRLHAVSTNTTEENPVSLVIFDQAELGEGVKVTLPEGGTLGSYANFLTVLDANGNPVAESIIEPAASPKPDPKPDPVPDPNPKPIPDTGEGPALFTAGGMLIASALAMFLQRRRLCEEK